jgi:hypothetical protein
MNVRTSWSDYFTGTPTRLQSQLYTSRQTPSYTNVYISNCLFISISSSNHGGALYFSSVTYLLVKSTSFFSCSVTNNYDGGAIYFTNSGSGQCVLHNVCGYDCYARYAMFAYNEVNNAISSKNYVNYSSITRCVKDSGVDFSLYLRNGKICCPSINISLNRFPHHPAIGCDPLVDSNSYTCSLTYSTFADTHAINHVCIYLRSSGANYEIKSCNILRNTQGNPGAFGTIYALGNLMIEDSCILANTATYIFCQRHSNYRITLSNCTVDSTSNNGYLIIQNTVTKGFILALNHMSNLICHADYDSIGTLTPITPLPPSPTKQMICFTYGNFYNQFQLRYLFSLISIFVFNFIHLDVSIDPLY